MSKHNLNHKILFENHLDSIKDAYDKEQYVLALFNECRITINYNGFYTTEAFTKDVLKDFYEVV